MRERMRRKVREQVSERERETKRNHTHARAHITHSMCGARRRGKVEEPEKDGRRIFFWRGEQGHRICHRDADVTGMLKAYSQGVQIIGMK
jgi:hypothetical protein